MNASNILLSELMCGGIESRCQGDLRRRYPCESLATERIAAKNHFAIAMTWYAFVTFGITSFGNVSGNFVEYFATSVFETCF